MRIKQRIKMLGFYFILFGLLFLSHVAYGKFTKPLKWHVYVKSAERFNILKEQMKREEFLRSEYRSVAEEAAQKIDVMIQDFQRTQVRKSPEITRWIRIIDITIGILFLIIGVRFFYTFLGNILLVRVGLLVLVCYIFVVGVDSIKDVSYLDTVSAEIYQTASLVQTTHPKLSQNSLAQMVMDSVFSSIIMVLLILGAVFPCGYFFHLKREITDKSHDRIL